jgi:peptidoglycan/LPS O-acetylase OafA/YrhL
MRSTIDERRIKDALAVNNGYVPHLDGWRGFAVLWVMLAHFFEGYGLVRLGWAGVNSFFILSGYLITGRLFYHEGQGGGGYFKNFYIRRILRIFPLYYGCLIIFFLLLPIFYGNYYKHFSDLHRHQIWYWLYINNWRIVMYGESKNNVLDTTWSLAVEEQFYLIWPFLFRYVKGVRIKIVMLCIITVSIMWRILTPAPYPTYYSTLTACEPLLLGAFICMLQKEGKLGVYARSLLPISILSLLVLGVIFYHDREQWIFNTWLIRYGYTAIDCILACLLYFSFLPNRASSVFRKALSAPWLVWAGKYSYGIYMIHFVLLTTVIAKGEMEMVARGINQGLAYWTSRIVGIAVVLAVSFASYHLYEKRFLRLKRYFV